MSQVHLLRLQAREGQVRGKGRGWRCVGDPGTAQGARTPTRFYPVNMLYLPCVAVRAEDLSIPASLSL